MEQIFKHRQAARNIDIVAPVEPVTMCNWFIIKTHLLAGIKTIIIDHVHQFVYRVHCTLYNHLNCQAMIQYLYNLEGNDAGYSVEKNAGYSLYMY